LPCSRLKSRQRQPMHPGPVVESPVCRDTAMIHDPLDNPEIRPFPHEDWSASASLSISIVEGPTINLWSIETPTVGKTEAELTLQLQRDQAGVIGRKEGWEIDYLDPRFSPTQMLPNSTRRVVTSFHRESVLYVSRGHVMLRGSAQGIRFVNGVPRRG